MIESSEFLKAQNESLEIQWAAASAYSVARARIIDGEITEPLQYSLGEGSFYAKLRNSLANDLSGAIATKNSTLEMRENGLKLIPQGNSESQALSMLGIDVGDLLQSVGNRIGRELALKLNDIEDDSEFWNRLAKKWKGLGMGELIITDAENLKIKVVNGNACGGKPEENGIFCLLDEGIISGIMQERHGVEIGSNQRVCTDCSNQDCYYEIESVIEQKV